MQDTSRMAALKGKKMGFVPTMGALHEGHMSLIKACRSENDATAASIFVNPAQFGPGEDFNRYPRDLDGDMAKFKEAGVDILFLPDAESMYPEGFSTFVEVKGLSDKLCGRFRPGHFRGVATVVAKLLNIVEPRRAYFGQKDYQQCLIIKRLVGDLNVPVEIITCPTVREHDGLAMSSRNRHLGPGERKAATVIYGTLRRAADMLKAGSAATDVKRAMKDLLNAEPLVAEIQYASVYDAESLDEMDEIKRPCLLAVAVKIGETRLMDNLIVS